ncbi:hypothetical protein AKJ16_DCAP25946, partial [Drosera capensis]
MVTVVSNSLFFSAERSFQIRVRARRRRRTDSGLNHELLRFAWLGFACFNHFHLLSTFRWLALQLAHTIPTPTKPRASLKPISIHFLDVKTIPDKVVAKCVMFDLQGSINFSKVSSANTCSAVGQGHFALVVEATAPSPAPVSPSPSIGNKKHRKQKFSKAWEIVLGVVGGVLLVVLLGLLIFGMKHMVKKQIEGMVRAAENNESLQMTPVVFEMGRRAQQLREPLSGQRIAFAGSPNRPSGHRPGMPPPSSPHPPAIPIFNSLHTT